MSDTQQWSMQAHCTICLFARLLDIRQKHEVPTLISVVHVSPKQGASSLADKGNYWHGEKGSSNVMYLNRENRPRPVWLIFLKAESS